MGLGVSLRKFADGPHRLFDLPAHPDKIRVRKVLFRKIQPRLHLHQQALEGLLDRLDLAGEVAVELALGKPEGRRALRLHDIGNRFGLDQVDPAVHEGPPGELPRFGQPNPLGHDEIQDSSNGQGSPVAMDLHHVLAGVRIRRPHDNHQGFVDNGVVPGIANMSVGEPVGWKSFGGRLGLKDLVRGLLCVRPGYPHDTDAADTVRGRDGDNRVPLKRQRRNPHTASTSRR